MPEETIDLIGFGGTHYAVRQTEIALSSRGAFGHIASARQVRSLDEGLVGQMRESSRAVAAYIDKKSLPAEESARIERMIGDAGIVLLSESEILEVGDLEWTTYLAIRDLAEDRSGSRVRHNLRGGTPVPVRLNPELIDETVKNNREEFLNLLEGLPVAHLSRGSMEVLPLVIGFEGATFRLVSDITTFCVKLLLICENTVIAGDHLILRKVRFDPAKARRHEVPKGPLFATLAGGRAIEIDGRRITPDMVQTTSVKRIHIPGLERYI